MDISLFQMPKAYDYQFKICIIGDTGCGKSSILKRFVDGTFSSVASNASVSIDFKHFMLEIGGFIIKLQILVQNIINDSQIFYENSFNSTPVRDLVSLKCFCVEDKDFWLLFLNILRTKKILENLK